MVNTHVEIKKLFLAAPGDVNSVVEAATNVVDSLNRTVARDKGVRLELVHWSTDASPEYGGDAQQLLNKQVAEMEGYELFVGILWNRFGTPTPRAASGTKEEFDRAVESFKKVGKPNIMFYFCQQPSNLNSTVAAEQKRLVLEFKTEIQENALTWDFEDTADFEKLFREHIERWLISHNSDRLVPPKIESETVRKISEDGESIEVKGVKDQMESAVSDSGNWVLLKNGFYLADEVIEREGSEIFLRILVSDSEDDASLRALMPNQFSRHGLIPFAFQNHGDVVRVLRTERKLTAGRNVWEFTVSADESASDNAFEMAVAGLSADEIAMKRARFILLNEEPFDSTSRTPGDLNQGMVEAFVIGIDTNVKAEGSVLPELWSNLDDNPDVFLPLARLWCVFHLLTSGCCEQILHLELGPIVDYKLRVKFRGRRRKQYTNVDAYIIDFEGVCDLVSSE